MKLYSGPLSLFARKVEIALGEKGLAFERIMVPFSQTRGYAPKDPLVLQANPKGQVPVLIDGNLTLYDSTIIIEYLDEAYPHPALLPQGAAARAKCRLLELEADEVFLQPVRKLMHRTEPPQPDFASRRLQQEEEAVLAEKLIAEHYVLLSNRLGQNAFLCGSFSLADIAMFMIVHYSLRLGGPELTPHVNVSQWYACLSRRASFAKIIAEISAADKELSYPIAPRRSAV